MNLSPHVDEGSGSVKQLQTELSASFFSQPPLTNQDPSVYSCAAVSVLTSTGTLISAAEESFSVKGTLCSLRPVDQEKRTQNLSLKPGAVRREGCWHWEALE